MKTYVALRGPLLTLEEYAELLIPSRTPQDLIEMFDLCKDIFSDDMLEFVSETMDILIMKYTTSNSRFCVDVWSAAINKLLSAGLDMHESRSRVVPGCTALYMILSDDFAMPVDILDCAEYCVEVLKLTSIDVNRYFYMEMLIRLEYLDDRFEIPEEWLTTDLEPWLSMDVRSRLQILFDLVNPGLRIPVHVDDGTKDNLLQLMPAFRYGGDYCLSTRSTEQPSHLDWKLIRLTDNKGPLTNWPFLKSTRSIYCTERGYKNLSEWTRNVHITHDKFLGLIGTRFERRQQRKWERLKKRTQFDDHWTKMPGGWAMEWWEYRGLW